MVVQIEVLISQSQLRLPQEKSMRFQDFNWEDGLDAEPQNYLVVPDQPWLDGFNVGKGTVRQFVAAPLGEGLTVEEQINANSDVGGIQLEFIPMKKEYFEKLKLEAQTESLHKFSEMPNDVLCKNGY